MHAVHPLRQLDLRNLVGTSKNGQDIDQLSIVLILIELIGELWLGRVANESETLAYFLPSTFIVLCFALLVLSFPGVIVICAPAVGIGLDLFDEPFAVLDVFRLA